jgi:hypothetical protein
MIGVLLRVSYELAREEAQSAETAQARVQAGVWA